VTELPQVPPPRCTHLHSTSLAVHGEGFADGRDRGDEEMTGCWCVQTGRPLGPDNQSVTLKACSDPDRDCYQEY
jgi:hypothetical protein